MGWTTSTNLAWTSQLKKIRTGTVWWPQVVMHRNCHVFSFFTRLFKPRRSTNQMYTTRSVVVNTSTFAVDITHYVYNTTHGIAEAFIFTVCRSVGLAVKRVDCDKTKLCPHNFLIHPSFLTRKMVGWSNPSTWNLGQTDPVAAKMPIFNRYSIVTPQS